MSDARLLSNSYTNGIAVHLTSYPFLITRALQYNCCKPDQLVVICAESDTALSLLLPCHLAQHQGSLLQSGISETQQASSQHIPIIPCRPHVSFGQTA